VATAFEIFWMIFEPILFGLTGTQIVLKELDLKIVTVTVMCVAIAFVVRKNKSDRRPCINIPFCNQFVIRFSHGFL